MRDSCQGLMWHGSQQVARVIAVHQNCNQILQGVCIPLELYDPPPRPPTWDGGHGRVRRQDTWVGVCTVKRYTFPVIYRYSASSSGNFLVYLLRAWSYSHSLIYTFPSLPHLSKHWLWLQQSSSTGRRDWKETGKSSCLTVPWWDGFMVFEYLPNAYLKDDLYSLRHFHSFWGLPGEHMMCDVIIPPAAVLPQVIFFQHLTPCIPLGPLCFLRQSSGTRCRGASVQLSFHLDPIWSRSKLRHSCCPPLMGTVDPALVMDFALRFLKLGSDSTPPCPPNS